MKPWAKHMRSYTSYCTLNINIHREDKEDTFTAITWPIYATELVGEGKHLVVEEKWQLQKAPEISHIYIWVIDCQSMSDVYQALFDIY
jgi:hypothetical protein